MPNTFPGFSKLRENETPVQKMILIIWNYIASANQAEKLVLAAAIPSNTAVLVSWFAVEAWIYTQVMHKWTKTSIKHIFLCKVDKDRILGYRSNAI